jgi:hypothetical protein
MRTFDELKRKNNQATGLLNSLWLFLCLSKDHEQLKNKFREVFVFRKFQ